VRVSLPTIALSRFIFSLFFSLSFFFTLYNDHPQPPTTEVDDPVDKVQVLTRPNVFNRLRTKVDAYNGEEAWKVGQTETGVGRQECAVWRVRRERRVEAWISRKGKCKTWFFVGGKA
jgi:hypothetical protein